MFTIPSDGEMDSYERGNENLLHAKNERNVLPWSETLVLSPVLNLQNTEFSTQFRTRSGSKQWLYPIT